jgi:hypothetical protein
MIQQAQQDEKFRVVDQLLNGEHARTLQAERLIFSRDLGLALSGFRAVAALPEKFRPRLADMDGKREAQLRRGQYVVGCDPTSGVRPLPRQRGMSSQHLAPLRLKAHNDLWAVKQREKDLEKARIKARAEGLPEIVNVGAACFEKEGDYTLQDVIALLQKLRDNIVDTVCTTDHPFLALSPTLTPLEAMHYVPQSLVSALADLTVDEPNVPSLVDSGVAFVRFEWPGRANRRVAIKGEFTNWEEQEMFCDAYTNM